MHIIKILILFTSFPPSFHLFIYFARIFQICNNYFASLKIKTSAKHSYLCSLLFRIILLACFSLFGGIGIWIQDFTTAKQVLYCVSLTSCLFWSFYFEDGGLKNYFPRLALNHDPPDLSLPSSEYYWYEPLVPDPFCFLEGIKMNTVHW
jgi:hypothetical protein